MLLRKRKASLEKEAKRLALIIEDYENKYIPMPEPDPFRLFDANQDGLISA